MMKDVKIFCIIPAFNEEENIAEVIKGVKPLVDRVVVIDDGSTDRTYDLATGAGATVSRHLINRGQGAALETGNEYALAHGADIIVHFDADGQFIPGEIPRLLGPIKRGECDVVLGSRFLSGTPRMPWPKKRIIFPLARVVNKLFFGVDFSDPQSGFRAWRSEALKKIKIENDGSAHCSEILYKIFKTNLKVKEVPITVIYREFGQNFFSGKGRKTGGLRILADLFMGKLLK
jgi:glycosyltransferase involved in cell wall biosynthesis